MNETHDLIKAQTMPPGLSFTSKQVELIKSVVAVGASNDELELFLYHARRTGLDPLARQIYCVFRFSNVQDPKTGAWRKERKMTIQTSIDGFRLIAERSGKYAGQVGPYWCGEDAVWREVWLDSEQPRAAKVGILRTDFREPLWAVARYDAYVQTKKDGQPTGLWVEMGDIMVAKCAEALGLRRAFPQELGGLYTGDEMMQAEVQEIADPKAPVARPDAMQKPTEMMPNQSEHGKPVEQPSDNAPPQTQKTEQASGAKLTIAQIKALETEARDAADRGSEVFAVLWKRFKTVKERAVIEAIGPDLRKRMQNADLLIAQEEHKDHGQA